MEMSDGPQQSSFGEAMDRLEAIVDRLEASEGLALEEALALYDEGLALAGDCRERLTRARLKLTEIAVPATHEPAGDAGQNPGGAVQVDEEVNDDRNDHDR